MNDEKNLFDCKETAISTLKAKDIESLMGLRLTRLQRWYLDMYGAITMFRERLKRGRKI